ncbi:AraC family transcriptional regulator [Cryptosporangium minutisporangium]|uniref:Helix-turn-helix transcriptional regulator n=1 Tax=Cryptosporangium minutisporangium TaxID=113569 RepID=A0ABP6TCX5_9ACTN
MRHVGAEPPEPPEPPELEGPEREGPEREGPELEGPEPDVRCYAVSHPGGPVRLPQDPAWHQLVYAVQGVLTVDTPVGAWVVPPHRAAWVPAGVTHRLLLSGRTTLRTLYLQRELALLPPICRVVDVSPLVRELILEAVRSAPLRMADPVSARLVGVLADQLATLPETALRLPVPRDPRAAAVAALLRTDPALDVSVDVLARRANASRRALERVFRAETGMSVGQWRRRYRMLEALRLLAAGESATSVAARVGYATPSAFSAAFRAELGGTPARWFDR